MLAGREVWAAMTRTFYIKTSLYNSRNQICSLGRIAPGLIVGEPIVVDSVGWKVTCFAFLGYASGPFIRCSNLSVAL